MNIASSSPGTRSLPGLRRRRCCDGPHQGSSLTSRIVVGVTKNGNASCQMSHSSDQCGADRGLFWEAQEQGYSRKKCAMTSFAVQRISRPAGVPVRTAAQRFLRSLNSLGVIVDDSVAEARN